MQKNEIHNKVKKLQAMIDGGTEHEIDVAKQKLYKILKKYDLTLDDLVCEERTPRYFKYRNRYQRKLINQLFAVMYPDLDVYKVKSSEELVIYLTNAEYAPLNEQYEFHVKQMQTEMDAVLEDFYTAYINKHDLGVRSGKEEGDEEPFDADKLARIIVMMRRLENPKLKSPYQLAMDKIKKLKSANV